jgi:putative ATP-dependent endonuclease of the OLD family
MKLTRLSVQNYRSFSEKTELALSGGMNALVGPNNCGKSNFLSAVGMALDPDYQFDRRHDVPGQRRFAFPRSTLTFQCEGNSSAEKTLLRYAEAYERSVASFKGSTYAQDGLLRFVVAYRVNETGATRQEYFAARGVGDLRGAPELNRKALTQFRKVIRFAAVDSGQSLASLLSGKFREILHAVLKEHLRQEFSDAEAAREQYVLGLQDQLLAPMREKVLQVAARLFPEICDVGLLPSVSGIDETLSDVEINIRDSVESSLRHKGTGVSGGVLVALLRYLADCSRQSLVFAIEEPETFLHPAAQEKLRDDLEGLAERDDVTLLVTTHSPFVLSRAAKAQVVLIAKRGDGVSRIEACAAGSEDQATAIASLYRDSTIPDLLDRYAAIPAAADAILLVEGTTDRDFLRTAARILGAEDGMARIHVLAAGGTNNLMAQTVLLRAEASQPVWVLVDSDDNGRKARDRLVSSFGVHKDDILEYGKFLNGLQDAESEWLFPAELMQRFVDEQGEEKVLKSKQRIGGQFRYDFTPAGKELFPRWLNERATAVDMYNWRPIIDTLLEKLSTRI